MPFLSADSLPLQSPSTLDLLYLALVGIFMLAAYLLSKLKGNLSLLGHYGLCFFWIFGIAGYLPFLFFKGLGIIAALIGTAGFILFFPFFVMAFSLFLEYAIPSKNSKLKKKYLLQASIYSLLCLGAFFLFCRVVIVTLSNLR